eukprot:COSAG01_NODE_4828_length_4710_cov_15.372587_5_plen_142_part_00
MWRWRLDDGRGSHAAAAALHCVAMPSSFSGRPFPAFTPAQRWHLDVYGFVVVPCTLTPTECGRLRQAVLSVRRELLGAPREMDQTVRADARGPGPGCVNTIAAPCQLLAASCSTAFSAQGVLHPPRRHTCTAAPPGAPDRG